MQLDVNKDLLGNMDYLKKLAEICRVTPRSQFDENLVYEVAFAHEYINSLILLDKSPSKDLIEIGVLFDGIMNMIDIKKLSKDKSDYKDLLKLKFANVDAGSYMKDIEVVQSPLMAYFKRRFSSIIMLIILSLVVLNMPFITEKLTSIVTSVVATDIDVISDIDSEDVKTVGEVSTYLEEGYAGIVKMISFLMNIIIMVMFTYISISTMISLLYICMPMMRVTGILDTFVSQDARECVMNETKGVGTVVTKVRNYDRIERNKLWLQTMMDKKTGNSSLDNDISELSKKLNGVRDRKSYYYDIAKVELLHSQYLQVVGAN